MNIIKNFKYQTLRDYYHKWYRPDLQAIAVVGDFDVDQMEKKVKADALAYQVTLRKFEEGLMSPLDVQTNATILLNSKADLLQKRLLYVMKCRQVDYYKGQPLIGN